ncbi:MAG TPA: RNB domain-containing ribonuclease [Proteobacteria bacterium]|mgnify:CR=1 FL=1|nr:RNB domain-containing ribonuclease [Pseudomonadota bacterium]
MTSAKSLPELKNGALLLYKSQPAKLIRTGDKLEIEIISSLPLQNKKVRDKDVSCLHPGPVENLQILSPEPELLNEIRALLSGEETTLPELAELLFNQTTPSSIWSAWLVVTEGLHFYGSPHLIQARNDEDYALEREKREVKKARREKWQAFIERVEKGSILEDDREFMLEIENLALGQGSESRLLQHLGRQQTQEHAHATLLELKFWPRHFNPYPQRLGVLTSDTAPEPRERIEILPETTAERLDLSELAAFAIDDEGSNDPDDAISFDGRRLWVHVADIAAGVESDSALDFYARNRAATLYLPEMIHPMLPPEFNRRFGIGLETTSSALSFALEVDDNGIVTDLEIIPSRIRVTRLNYAEAEKQLLCNPILQRIELLTAAHRQLRLAAGAIEIDLPECRIKAENGKVKITPLPSLASRVLVSEAMLMAGAATARYAERHALAMPYAGQPKPMEDPTGATNSLPELVAMYNLRRKMKPGRPATSPLPHAGLGLNAYVRVTSPLRRYLDLVAHQQLRLHLAGRPPLSAKELGERIMAVSLPSTRVRQAERLANRHWTLLYLQQNPDWRGKGIVVARWNRKVQLLIPELALETELSGAGELVLGSWVQLDSPRINLPWLEVFFRSKPL